MILQCLERLMLCFIPFPFPGTGIFGFLLLVRCWYQVCKRSTDLAEILDKTSVVPNESPKSSYVLGVVGVGQLTTLSVFPWSISIPFSDTTCPTYLTLRLKKSHLLRLSFRLASLIL
jgi:hypothetical protein